MGRNLSKLMLEDCNFSFWEKFLIKIGWYKFTLKLEEWVYPAYNLKNLLFHRYDRIKVPQIKPYEYTDMNYFMLCAVMEMIVKFIEEENPEKYICWYKDEEGNDVGHKYGENDNYTIMFPEYKDKWIMDIIKEIYHWWKKDYPRLLEEKEYILSFWNDYLAGDWKKSKEDENGNCFYELTDENTAKSMDDLKDKDIKWEILDKHLDRNKLFEGYYVHQQYLKLDVDIHNLCQKYLHLAIDVRPYLWT